MKLAAIISTLVGIIITIASIQQNSYIWMIGSMPLTIIGLLLFLTKDTKKETKTKI